jgi:protein O-mannosyl-transferase
MTVKAIFSTRQSKVHLLLLILCVMAVNLNTLSNGFVYDDVSQVVNNSWITSIKYVPEIFSRDATHASVTGYSNYYRPLMNITYLACYYLFAGVKAWGFHLVNVLFHLAVTVMVYVLTARLARDEQAEADRIFTAPSIAALIFALHPIHTEVVAWVACVPELTFTLFCLLAFNFHINSLECSSRRDQALSVAFFGLAVFCKETSVTLLPMLLLYEYLFRSERPGLRQLAERYLPYLGPIALYLAMRFHALGGVAPMRRHADLSTFQHLLNAPVLFAQYLGKLIAPVNLNIFYVLHPVLSVGDLRFLGSLAAVAGFLGAAVYFLKKDKALFLSLVLLSLPLVPVLYIPVLGENSFAERYLYFPSVGFAMAVGYLYRTEVAGRNSWRLPVQALLVVCLAIFGVGTTVRNQVWHDEFSLWTDTVPKSPDSDLVHHNMGNALAEKGDIDGAIREFQIGIGIKPDGFDLYNSLGVALSKKGDQQGAIKALQKAMTLSPKMYGPHINLGIAYASAGNLDAAAEEFRKALELNPQSFELRNNLGNIYAMKGNLDAAIKEFEGALAIKPDFAEAQANLQVALNKKGGLASPQK